MDLKHTEDFFIRSLLNKVQLKEIMTRDIIVIDVNAPFSQVYDKFANNKIRHLPVVVDKNHLVGIITQRDLYRIQSPRHLEDGEWYYDREMLDSYILQKVMTPKPFILTPEHSVAAALLAMVDYKYSCIPIVERGDVLCGIITQIDILKIGAQILREK